MGEGIGSIGAERGLRIHFESAIPIMPHMTFANFQRCEPWRCIIFNPEFNQPEIESISAKGKLYFWVYEE